MSTLTLTSRFKIDGSIQAVAEGGEVVVKTVHIYHFLDSQIQEQSVRLKFYPIIQ